MIHGQNLKGGTNHDVVCFLMDQGSRFLDLIGQPLHDRQHCEVVWVGGVVIQASGRCRCVRVA